MNDFIFCKAVTVLKFLIKFMIQWWVLPYACKCLSYWKQNSCATSRNNIDKVMHGSMTAIFIIYFGNLFVVKFALMHQCVTKLMVHMNANKCEITWQKLVVILKIVNHLGMDDLVHLLFVWYPGGSLYICLNVHDVWLIVLTVNAECFWNHMGPLNCLISFQKIFPELLTLFLKEWQ